GKHGGVTRKLEARFAVSTRSLPCTGAQKITGEIIISGDDAVMLWRSRYRVPQSVLELMDDLRPQPPPFNIIIFSEAVAIPLPCHPRVLKRLKTLLYSFLVETIFSECLGDPVSVSPKGAEEAEITPLQFS